MANIKTITLGCRFNFYESEHVKAILTSLDLSDDVVFINTCSVTQSAENQSKQAVRKAIRENPNAKIIVTGCSIATAKEYFENLDGVYAVITNDNKTNVSSYTNIPHGSDNTQPTVSFDKTSFKDRVKVFLQIQCGCDNFCTYCIVPFARGRSHSMPANEILDKVRFFVKQGFKEIVLSGIDITSYKDAGLNFNGIVKCILDNVPDLQRLRISSLNPNGIDKELIELMKNPRIMPHLHLSIQSGDDDSLKAMRRKYSIAELTAIIKELKNARSDLVLGADVIAGFPTETATQFENTYSYIRSSGISLLHVFPYSPRPGTVASRLVQLPRNTILERAKKLRMLALDLKTSLQQSLIGTKVSGLVEKCNNNCATGKLDNFLEFIANESIPMNTVIINKTVTSVINGKLLLK